MDNPGNQQRFRRCFDEYSRIVYSVAFTMMKNTADSNDVMQEVFLKFYQNMDKLTEEAHVRPWLITVTMNTCRNELRSGGFSRTVRRDNLDEASYDEDFGEKSDLFYAVMELPEKERVPIHLFYYEGCSTSEIAKFLNMKESTVRVRIMRGREKLKKKLKEEMV